MAHKYGLQVELVEMQWKLLPVRLHLLDDYHGDLERARIDLQGRDPEDAHVLALARSLKIPIWSNDRDLSSLDDECYPTAQLLKLLESSFGPRK